MEHQTRLNLVPQAQPSRRDFLKATAAVSVALGAGRIESVAASVPRRPLGSSGLVIPILGFGTAAAGRDLDRKAAMDLFHAAIDAGVTAFDTAPDFMGYGRASEYLAPILKERRDEAFVITKVFTDDAARAERLLRDNLHALGVERADLVLIHSVGDARIDPARLLGPQGALAALRRAKKDGVTRAIGLSAHGRLAKLSGLLRESEELDAILVPVTPDETKTSGFEPHPDVMSVTPGIGVLGFKVLGGATGMNPDRVAAAFRFAWSFPGLASAIVGFRSRSELESAVQQARIETSSLAPGFRSVFSDGSVPEQRRNPVRGSIE